MQKWRYLKILLLLSLILTLGLIIRAHLVNKVLSQEVAKLCARGGDLTVELPAVCEVPSSGFRSWNDGVVTTLKPVIPRNCSRLFNRSLHDVTTTIANNRNWKSGSTDLDILRMTSNCSQVAQYFENNLYM